jgi:LuxR family maltose regulon positive regulatory protein
LQRARESGQFEIEHRTLFYLLRLALGQGHERKAEQVLREMEVRLHEKSYSHRFFNQDAAYAWYYCALRRPESVPAWLREQFASYRHAYYIENLGNQIKARYHYLTGNYLPLLSYIEGVKQRERVLYGYTEMLALEACVHFQMKNRPAALNALRGAYEAAAPNDILLPFTELGKDMRSLVSAALRGPDNGLPEAWLEMVRRKSSTFAKYQSLMIANYEKSHACKRRVALTVREKEILADLYRGFSRPEIAAGRSLSIHTVNSAVNHLFNKLGAQTIVDAVRIAAEEKLL